MAEADLAIRGPGTLLGTRQAGLPDFRVANLLRDADVLGEARAANRQVRLRDPEPVAGLRHDRQPLPRLLRLRPVASRRRPLAAEPGGAGRPACPRSEASRSARPLAGRLRRCPGERRRSRVRCGGGLAQKEKGRPVVPA
ncbi:MAG: hypothetical protein ACKOTZ_06190, partial [Chloroflexota bacterium]